VSAENRHGGVFDSTTSPKSLGVTGLQMNKNAMDSPGKGHQSTLHSRSSGYEAQTVSGDELSTLLFPTSPQTFIDEYWQRKPLFLKGAPEKFEGLFDFSRFQRAIKQASELVDPSGFSIGAFVREDSLTFTESIDVDDVESCLARGATVCVNAINLGDDDLTYYASAIREQMSYAGLVRFNCYLSPDGSGAPTHFDARVSLTLQIKGRKRWRFSPRPAMHWPPSNAQIRSDGTPYWMLWNESPEWSQLESVDEATFVEVVLEPGDLLCLPSGTWHTAKAVGQSLALNLVFNPYSFFGFLTHLLESELLSRAEWRGSPPPIYVGDLRPAELPSQLETYVAERLFELDALVEKLKDDPACINRVWRDLIKYETF
jgi:ribosomal protein L16 Arg81 hydroxylase